MKILIIPGLTLQEVTETDLARIRSAAGDADIVVSDHREAIRHIADADVVLGFVTREMFLAARLLRWVQSISSGVDAFLYDEFRDSDVVLTSEKGLVGEHLADHGFGLLLMLTRQLGTALRHGPDAWNHRPEMRSREVELTGATMGVFGLRRHRPRHGPARRCVRHDGAGPGPGPGADVAGGGRGLGTGPPSRSCSRHRTSRPSAVR